MHCAQGNRPASLRGPSSPGPKGSSPGIGVALQRLPPSKIRTEALSSLWQKAPVSSPCRLGEQGSAVLEGALDVDAVGHDGGWRWRVVGATAAQGKGVLPSFLSFTVTTEAISDCPGAAWARVPLRGRHRPRRSPVDRLRPAAGCPRAASNTAMMARRWSASWTVCPGAKSILGLPSGSGLLLAPLAPSGRRVRGLVDPWRCPRLGPQRSGRNTLCSPMKPTCAPCPAEIEPSTWWFARVLVLTGAPQKSDPCSAWDGPGCSLGHGPPSPSPRQCQTGWPPAAQSRGVLPSLAPGSSAHLFGGRTAGGGPAPDRTS